MIEKVIKLSRRIEIKLRRKLKRRRFIRDISNLFPSNLIDVLVYSFEGLPSESEKRLGALVEGLRDEVMNRHLNDSVKTFGSPRSGAALTDTEGAIVPGAEVESKNAGFARTGTKVREGIQLKRIAEAMQARNILELGTNTGLSGCYFLSSYYRPFLHSVEGSAQLCQIAELNLSRISSDFHVANAFFDDELIELKKREAKFDLAFIDGQHEEQATLYYANAIKPLLNPGGGILFDDIYWSEGMHRAWCMARDDADYGITMEVGSRGLCILPTADESTDRLNLNLSDYLGHPLLTRRGW